MSMAVPRPIKLSVNRSFRIKKPKLNPVRGPTVASITQKETAPPLRSAKTKPCQICPRLTGSTFVLSILMSSSVFTAGLLLSQLEDQGLHPAMDGYFDVRLGHPRSSRS